MTAQAHRHDIDAGTDGTEAEMVRWFFEVVLPRWDAAIAGSVRPAAIADLCAAPMVVATCDRIVRASDHADMTRIVAANVESLRPAGIDHVLAPDCRVTAYSPRTGAVDVLWSLRTADGSEIMRLAGRYDIAHLDGQWRVTAAHVMPTDQSSLDRVFTPTPANDIG